MNNENKKIEIYQCYVDMDNKWFKISEERFLELTEDRGYYKKDSALKVLKQMKRMRTDFAYFKYEYVEE